MPVRSLNSSVIKWPDEQTVRQAAREWAEDRVRKRPDIVRIAYFGSYARGDWGVGSDLDLLVVIEASGLPFHQRALEWDVLDLPVPVDLLVYTAAEWQALKEENSAFYRKLTSEAVYLFRSDE